MSPQNPSANDPQDPHGQTPPSQSGSNPSQPPAAGSPTGVPDVATESTKRNWAMLCHLTALAGLVVPVGNIIGPLVVWLIKRNDLEIVEEHGKEALNFQISMTIYFVISLLLIFVIIGFFLAVAVAIADIILVIIASIKASNGEAYKYPLTLRLII